MLYSVIGWNVIIGMWIRVEGILNDFNLNKLFVKVDVKDIFSFDGKFNLFIIVIGEFYCVNGNCLLIY